MTGTPGRPPAPHPARDTDQPHDTDQPAEGRLRGGVLGVVLAAGRSSRMGRPKQLAELAGRPLLEHVLATLAAAPLDGVVVALGAHACRIQAQVDLHGAVPFVAPGWREGMGTVLAQTAAAYGPGRDALVVALGDQPLVNAAAVGALVAAWRGGAGPVVSAAYDGRPGHPKLFARPALERLTGLRGDRGARDLLAAHPEWVSAVDVGGSSSDTDIDDEAGLERARLLLTAGTDRTQAAQR
jgi:CTP:molybdopterin cytidylyltransferase MocA